MYGPGLAKDRRMCKRRCENERKRVNLRESDTKTILRKKVKKETETLEVRDS